MYVIPIYPSMSNKVLEGLSEFNAVLALLEAFRTRGAHAESIMASAQLVSKCCLPGSSRVSQGLPGSSRGFVRLPGLPGFFPLGLRQERLNQVAQDLAESVRITDILSQKIEAPSFDSLMIL